MAQPLSDSVPAFCLVCLGTNNKFTSDLLLKRWNYIFREEEFQLSLLELMDKET